MLSIFTHSRKTHRIDDGDHDRFPSRDSLERKTLVLIVQPVASLYVADTLWYTWQIIMI